MPQKIPHAGQMPLKSEKYQVFNRSVAPNSYHLQTTPLFMAQSNRDVVFDVKTEGNWSNEFYLDRSSRRANGIVY